MIINHVIIVMNAFSQASYLWLIVHHPTVRRSLDQFNLANVSRHPENMHPVDSSRSDGPIDPYARLNPCGHDTNATLIYRMILTLGLLDHTKLNIPFG